MWKEHKKKIKSYFSHHCKCCVSKPLKDKCSRENKYKDPNMCDLQDILNSKAHTD